MENCSLSNGLKEKETCKHYFYNYILLITFIFILFFFQNPIINVLGHFFYYYIYVKSVVLCIFLLTFDCTAWCVVWLRRVFLRCSVLYWEAVRHTWAIWTCLRTDSAWRRHRERCRRLSNSSLQPASLSNTWIWAIAS